MLHLDRADRLAWLASMRDGLRRFPEVDRSDEASMLRGIAVRDAVNRMIFRVQTSRPRFATALAERIRIEGVPAELRDVPLERPIVIGLMHFGPIYAAITLAMRLLKGRRVFVFHAGGELGHAVSRYFRAIGAIPVLNDRGSLAAVEARLADGLPSAVILCFDYLGGYGNQSVPFLGGTLSVPTGLARLVDRSGAFLVLGWFETARTLPRLRLSAVHAPDATTAPDERCSELTRSVYRLLETRVRAAPQAWTEWRNCR